MKAFRWMLAAAVVGTMCLVSWQAFPATTKTPKEIVFLDFKTGMQLQKKLNKPTMIHFTTTWCGWCRKLEKEVYTVPEVIEMSRNFVCIQVDGDKLPEACAHYKVRGYPTIVFTDAKRNEVHRIPGYMPAEGFLAQMKAALAKTGAADAAKKDSEKEETKKEE